jgi:hypothetical protein
MTDVWAGLTEEEKREQRETPCHVMSYDATRWNLSYIAYGAYRTVCEPSGGTILFDNVTDAKAARLRLLADDSNAWVWYGGWGKARKVRES